MPENENETIDIPVGQQEDGTVAPPEPEDEEQRPETDTFDREYVQELRDEAAQHRVAAREATEALEPLQRRLFTALVEATGLMADPTDMPFDAALLDEGLEEAVEGLLAAKPHLRSRKTRGDIGQGLSGNGAGSGFSLAGVLSERA